MSSQAIEHPSVSLRVDHLLLPHEQAAITAANSSTKAEDSFSTALMVWRAHAIRRLKDEMVGKTLVDDALIRKTLDTIWVSFIPIFRRATGPMIAEAYITAFRAVHEDNVPIQLIYSLADQHADRVGKYFNDTSTEALIQGFNTYVNRKVPQRAALERVVDAYGMTPRQMNGFTSATALQPAVVESSVPRNMKKKIQQYIGAAIAARLKIFKGQEAHNLDEQAKQIAWLYLVQHGTITENYQKQWITAEDEKVCAVCAPMHKKKVPIKEKFELPNGGEIYVPSPHVNCRCHVRLVAPIELVAKADWDAGEHPRGGNPENRGQFSAKPRPPTALDEGIDPDVKRLLQEIQQRDAIEAAKIQELREARAEAKKKTKPSLKPLTGQKLEAQKLTTLQPLKLQAATLTPVGLQAQPEAALEAKPATLARVETKLTPQLRAQVIARAKERLEVVTPIKPTYVRNAVPIGKPVYHRSTIGGDELEDEHADNRKALFDEEAIWYSSRDKVINEAIDAAEDEAAKIIDFIMTDNADPLTGLSSETAYIKDHATNEYFVVPLHAIEKAVHSGIFGHPSDPDDPVNGSYWLSWDKQTPINRRILTHSELLERLELNPEDYIQTIYITERGNDNETEQLDAGTKSSYETWLITGGLVVQKIEEPDYSTLPIRFVHLDSEAATQAYGQD